MSTISNAEYYTYFSMWSNTYFSRPREDYVYRYKAGQADGRSDHQADQGDSARSVRGSRQARSPDACSGRFRSRRITEEHRIVHRVEDDTTNHLKTRYPINPSYTARSFSEKQQKTTFSIPGQLFSVSRTVSTAIIAAWSTG